MSVYHQMGHDSENLLRAERLDAYKGAILSPVNYDEEQTQAQIARHQDNAFEMIFDPQIYYPNTERGQLSQWRYFPSDVDSADQSSLGWWTGVVKGLVEVVETLRPNAVCSPAVVPRAYTDGYYALSRDVTHALQERLSPAGIATYQTILVRLEELAVQHRAVEIASIVSRGDCDLAYLVLISDVEPRREFRDTEALQGGMRLIKYLEDAGIRVLVGFVCSDLILWKAAGASHCATGKFFNLRRFTPSRFAPPPEGGGQVPYWFEEALMAFLRESDLVRVRRAGLLSSVSKANPFGNEILSRFDNEPGAAWIALSWRQYLYWFGDLEARLRSGAVGPDDVLKRAEMTWDELEERTILMEERANDSGWLRPWRRAIAEAFSID